MKRQFTGDSRRSTVKPFKMLLPTAHCRPRTLLPVALALALVSTAQAQTVTNAAGTAIPLDTSLDTARSAAMGSAFTAVADDGSALFWNPAGLGNLQIGEISLHHQSWLADTNQDSFLAAFPMADLGGWGVAADYFNYGTFAGRDSNGTPTPSFTADQMVFQAGWGKKWGGGFSAGLGLLLSQQNLAGSPYTSLFSNLGVLFQPSPDWSLGMAANGLGQGGTQGNLPFALRLGAAFKPALSKDLKLLVAWSGSVEAGSLERFQWGGEGVFEGHFALRAGYQWDLTDNQLNGLNGLTLGAGCEWQGLTLDYAFLPMGELGASQRISLSYRFAAEISKTATATQGTGKTNGAAPIPTPLGSAPPAGPPPTLPYGEETGPSASHHPGEERDGLGGEVQLPAETLRQGKELEDQGRAVEAIRLYIQSVQNDQKDLLAWWGLGNAYYRLGREDYARQCFEQVLRIKPDASGLRDWLDRYKAATPAATPSVSMTVSEVSTSLPSSGEGDDLEIQFKLQPDILQEGKELEKEGKYLEAIHVYTQAIQDDQKNLLAWWGLGNVYYRLGRKEYAVQCFEKVLEIKPDAKGLADWLEKYH